ncbi:MAG: hypothetical protein KKD39_06725 [Candidatus Altiarchaeota archaeon]|nr:hypothetical protein [Candidatus Altiarchaeota archaeon]
MNQLILEVEADPRKADAVLKSIKPEIEEDIHTRSSIDLKYESGKLILEINAKDLTAMRAAANTYIRWLDMCMKITEK